MDMRSGLDGLRSLLGVSQTGTAGSAPARNGAAAASTAVGADSATLSQAASQVSETSAGGDVRMEKVSGIQAALAAGTYSVAPSLVASRLVDSMLSAGN